MSGPEAPERLRFAIRLEIMGLLERIAERRDLLLAHWSRARDRGVFLHTIEHRWSSLSMETLLMLDSRQLERTQAFYAALDEFELLLQTTEAMPVTLSEHYDEFAVRLQALGRDALSALV